MVLLQLHALSRPGPSPCTLPLALQGAATVRALMPEAISVFVAAESQAKLVERLAARKTETPDKMRVRVQTAQHEMAQMKDFDYGERGCVYVCVWGLPSWACMRLAVRSMQKCMGY